ncbi:ABC transporter ATP-binding protein [Leucobacter luti]|uniref:Nucleoside ABC transporter ATP-binding protein n=1 Tax=Leucobacter luti TaxID=340320 RepID=A0A4Q7U6E8_9MICO|nr:ABC transporter ATP-binding protein [Leucobacter luti]MBL3700641.1 ABC transporter ATP-binding protein [Leucobacter luti]RZT68520.1 nucleoside ABC transporter ATP-binding protein [Leucobacter luti]
MTVEVSMRGITKRFPGVLADDNVDFTVEAGEIHALMGENGAGKSILMSQLAGVMQPDEGEIIIRGERKTFASPLDAIDAGIGMVFQSFKLFPSLTIAENVVFRSEPTKRGLIDRQAANRRVAEIADRYGLQIDPTARVDSVPVGVLQRVEIVKALYRDARVLILDEPTAVLTPQETERLFDVLRALKADGRTIILITHKLGEVMAISDRVTVLRDGRNVAELVTAESSPAEITRHMTGRDVDLTTPPPALAPGDTVLDVRELTVPGSGGRDAVSAASLTVRAGEVVGIAGVAGNGQVELAEAIIGMRRASSGQVFASGTDLSRASIAQRRDGGISYIPEDRHAVGSAGSASAVDNLALGHHRSAPILRGGLLSRAAMVEHAKRLISRFGVKIASPATPVGTLSGGNLQKIVVARELDYRAPILISEQPTRGVDIGAIESIHRELCEYRDGGGALLLISAELSEIMSLSSRILVMFEGRLVAELPQAEATEALLGLYMAGHEPEAQHRPRPSTAAPATPHKETAL